MFTFHTYTHIFSIGISQVIHLHNNVKKRNFGRILNFTDYRDKTKNAFINIETFNFLLKHASLVRLISGSFIRCGLITGIQFKI